MCIVLFCFDVLQCPGSAQAGEAPLGIACGEGHVEVVKKLLSAGANTEAVGNVCVCLSHVPLLFELYLNIPNLALAITCGQTQLSL